MPSTSAAPFRPVALLLALASAVPLAAQTAPAAPTDEVVELSPFTVTAADDRGYQALNSLAGSRLKTPMRDIATPVSAFTEQFFLDTAITDTNQLADFMINTEFSFNEDAGSTGTNQNLLNGNARPLRMRGLPGGSVTTNFFSTGGVADTFSTERVEQARGPNSILFGIGNPGGLINATTKRARFDRNTTALSASMRSYNGTRFDFDHNQVIVKDRASVRLASVRTRYGGWRNFEFRDVDGYFGTAKVALLPGMELNVEGERMNVNKHTNRTFTAIDAYTRWRDAGKVITTADTAVAEAGITRISANPWLVFTTNTGELASWRNKNTTAVKITPGGADNPVLTDFSVLPPEASFYGPGYDQNTDYSRVSAYLTQTFGDLNIELAAMRLSEHRFLWDPQQNISWFLRADPNAYLPQKVGTTAREDNPFAGMAYFEAQPQNDTADERTNFVRATASYRFRLGWAGEHLIGGLIERDTFESERKSLREYVISANAPTPLAGTVSAASNINNRVFRRTYIDFSRPSQEWYLANPQDFSTNGLVERTTGATYRTAFIPHDANTRLLSNDKNTYIGFLQSGFWKNRVKTVVGVSRDERDTYQSTQKFVPIEGGNGGIAVPVKNDTPFSEKATNVSFSGVFKATDWLNLTYSKSENSGLAPNSGLMHSPTGRPPAAKGRSEDVGLKLALLNDRVHVTALYYQTSADDDSQTGSIIAGGTINAVWGALNAQGVRDASGNVVSANTENSNVYTFSSASQGYEAEITANLTSNWRALVNYANAKTVRTNIAPEMADYLREIEPFWTEGDRARMLLDGSGLAATARTDNGITETVQEQVDLIKTLFFENQALAEGRMPIGQVKHKVNARTNYDFTEGWLRGVSIGGGVRYRSQPVIGFESVKGTNGEFIRTVRLGSEQVYFDANIGYRRKSRVFGRNLNWSLQLNVNNLLDNDAYMVTRLNSAGAVTAYRFNDPRTWVLTYRVNF